MIRQNAIWTAVVGVIVVVVVVLALETTKVLTTPGSALDVRPWILLVALVGLNSITYVVWFSRWNVVAHLNLAFSVVAYVIPLVMLDHLHGLTSDALDVYYQISAAGLLLALFGVLIGARLASDASAQRWRERANFEADDTRLRIQTRTAVFALLAVFGVLASFAAMHFIPAFAADPNTAKFFRGAYSAAYRPVAPLYRTATSLLTVLVPLVLLYAFIRRRMGWLVIASAAIGCLLLGLLRDPAVSGSLLLLGVYVAVKRKSLTGYFLVLVSVYMLGSALYFLMNLLGVGHFSAATASGTFLDEVSAGAPDVSDQVHFLTAWLTDPQYTLGRTWIGGLSPGNNPWNPSVWSLLVVNPGQDISTIPSGGLRLTAPIWGFVSFGWPGVIGVSFVYGILQGVLAGWARRVVPSSSFETATYWTVAYFAASDVIPNFFRLSYLSVLQLAFIGWLLFVNTRPRQKAGSTAKLSPRTASVTKARERTTGVPRPRTTAR